jgi:energy-coupling factor transporter ATP-binding protein EcfA2
MKPHPNILIVGKRGAGKSTLLQDIMCHLAPRVDVGLAMTPDEASAGMFRQHMPGDWVRPGFDEDELESMLCAQRALFKRGEPPGMFVLMDDCMHDRTIHNGLAVRDLFLNGKYLHITLCNTVQNVVNMDPELRMRVDYVFVFRENIRQNGEQLWQYFFGLFDTYSQFQHVMHRCTENHKILVLDNTVPTNKLEECVYWYRARTDLPACSMGKSLWTLFECEEHDTPHGGEAAGGPLMGWMTRCFPRARRTKWMIGRGKKSRFVAGCFEADDGRAPTCGAQITKTDWPLTWQRSVRSAALS